jgi:hypothetical protein
MKKSVICMAVLVLSLALAVPSFCEETVAQESSQQESAVPVVTSVNEEVKAEEPKTEVKEESPAAPVATETKKILNYSKEKSRTEIEVKVGKTISPKPEINRESVDVDSVYTLGIEVVAYSNSFIGLGAGIYNVFDSKIKQNGHTISGPDGEYELAFTNPYLTLKSKILQFDSEIIRNVYIYGQLGYGFMRIKNAYETEDGMYWGVGGGVEIWHFLLDVNYATNFGKIKIASGENKLDVRQSTIIVSLGYRFSL